MMTSFNEMMELYDQLNVNEKRNEFSSLLEKTNQIISTLLKVEGIENNAEIKNYNSSTDATLTEGEMFTFLYEDLWNIKNRLLSFLILKSSKDSE